MARSCRLHDTKKIRCHKKKSRGDKRMEHVDSSPLQAVELLAAASLHGMLTNPSTTWFTLRYKDQSMDADDEAKLWLEVSN